MSKRKDLKVILRKLKALDKRGDRYIDSGYLLQLLFGEYVNLEGVDTPVINFKDAKIGTLNIKESQLSELAFEKSSSARINVVGSKFVHCNIHNSKGHDLDVERLRIDNSVRFSGIKGSDAHLRMYSSNFQRVQMDGIRTHSDFVVVNSNVGDELRVRHNQAPNIHTMGNDLVRPEHGDYKQVRLDDNYLVYNGERFPIEIYNHLYMGVMDKQKKQGLTFIKGLDKRGSILFVVTDGITSAHGNTKSDAFTSFKFKKERNKDVEDLKKEIIESGVITDTQYRILTGACRYGVNKFKSDHSLDEVTEISLDKLHEILDENDFGYGNFMSLYQAYRKYVSDKEDENTDDINK